MSKNNLLLISQKILIIIFIFGPVNADASMSRRGFLRAALSATGTAAFGGSALTQIGLGADEIELWIRDIAEIRNLQWNYLKKPFLLKPDFIEQYIKQLNSLDLHSKRGLHVRQKLVERLVRQMTELGLSQAKTYSNEVENIKSEISSTEGQNILNRLNDSLTYNIILIRGLLPPFLYQRVNSNHAWDSLSIEASDYDMLMLRDYYLLLTLAKLKFNEKDSGYDTLTELLDDTQNWFPSLSKPKTASESISCNDLMSR